VIAQRCVAHDHRQMGQLWSGQAGDHARSRTPPAQAV
jgi:hypothetical protein